MEGPSQHLTMKDFEEMKELGSGSFGKVQLVKNKNDGQLYALKSVLLTRLTQKEKDNALNEVRLLASINIPTVIGYKGAFFNVETQSLCVIMEYADGGDLQVQLD